MPEKLHKIINDIAPLLTTAIISLLSLARAIINYKKRN